MPKSKRNKIVHLTQVKKKGKDHKEDLMKQLEQYVDQFQRVFLFDFDETKSDRIMNLRVKLKDQGRIFAGRNSLVDVTLRAIGRRTRTNYASLVSQITGHRGLFFTNLECNKLVQKLEAEHPEFKAKLLGYAQLKSTDDDDGSDANGDDDDDDADDDADETNDAAGDKGPARPKTRAGPRKRVTFVPIGGKSKAKKAVVAKGQTTTEAAAAAAAQAKPLPLKGQAKKSKAKAKAKGAKGTPMET